MVDLLLAAPILAVARRAVWQQGSRKVAQHGEGTLVMAAILMLSLAGAGAARLHCVPAPDLWVPLDADLAAMGFFLHRVKTGQKCLKENWSADGFRLCALHLEMPNYVDSNRKKLNH